jgi:hypothetical protein
MNDATEEKLAEQTVERIASDFVLGRRIDDASLAAYPDLVQLLGAPLYVACATKRVHASVFLPTRDNPLFLVGKSKMGTYSAICNDCRGPASVIQIFAVVNADA